MVFDLINNYEEIVREVLDTNENSKYPETAHYLFQVMLDGSQMIVRDNNRTGLKILSLEDGQIISQKSYMHEKSIMNFLIMSDNQTVITCGKDKQV